MSKKISTRRKEMGEVEWKTYQGNKKKENYARWSAKNKDKVDEYKKKRSMHVVFFRTRLKKKLIEYKGGKCSKCGYDKDVPSAYDFHHRNPQEKEFAISQYMVLDFEKLKPELNKCDLVCKNCHAEIHDNANKEARDIMYERYNLYAETKVKRERVRCLVCDDEFQQTVSHQKYCSQVCANKDKRKVVEWPTKEDLEKMIREIPMTKIGEKYGVSDNAVRKWAKIYQIPVKAISPFSMS